MTLLAQPMTLSVPLTQADHDQARLFAQRQTNPVEAERMFRNTLAVLTTRYYLQMLGISSNLEESYSWQPIAQQLGDFADLYIPESRGRLDCRPVQAGETTCYLPQDALANRIGYVVVRFDETFTAGEILGFVRSASLEDFPLSYLRSLDELIDCLDTPQPTHLKQWLNDTVDAFWQSLNALPPLDAKFAEKKETNQQSDDRQRQLVEALYAAEQAHHENLVIPDGSSMGDLLAHLIQVTQNEETRFQAAELLWQLDPRHEQAGVCKVADTGLQFAGATLVLMTAILQRLDGRYSVLCRLYSTNRQRLPKGIRLSALDTQQSSFFEVTSREQDDYIQFKLIADEGDTFFTRVSSPEACITECFVLE